jgi:hypothetical protein
MTKKLEKLEVETTEEPEPAEIDWQIRNLNDKLEATEKQLIYQLEREKEYQSRIAELNRELESIKKATAKAKLAFLKKQESRLRREIDQLEQSIAEATGDKDTTKPTDSHPSKPKILQKGLHPFILASTVYIPTFIYILNQTPTVLDGMVDLTAGDYRCRLRLPVRNKTGFWAALRSFRILKIPLADIGTKVNTKIHCSFPWNNKIVRKHITYRQKRFENNTKLYYLPFSIKRDYNSGNCAHLRRTLKGTLTIVQRPLAGLEHTLRFRFLESWLVSVLLYSAGRLVSRLTAKNVAIFYEKFASQSDEGVYDIFLTARKTTNSDCYYITDTDNISADDGNVLRKYSVQYYWVIYRAAVFIGAEAPTHLTLLRSNNRWLRRSIYTRPFVFLQHGIIYMKNMSKNSVFVAGCEGAADYIVASSEKERDIIVRDLRYKPEQVLVCGIAQHAIIPYQHITDSSPDIVTVMLTWKHSQEHLPFEASANFQELQCILPVLRQRLPDKNIRLVLHPKDSLSAKTVETLGAALWTASVKEALSGTKLLITDYSSICYNAFYQGAGVIFYQPDLDEYQRETGKLIPADDEFIGPRLFSTTELQKELKRVIGINGHIALKKVRTKKYEKIYSTINEFTDGENIERIVEAVQELELL